MSALRMVCVFARALVQDKLELAAENLSLRQQLAVQQRSARRPRLRRLGGIFWVWLSKTWGTWQSALLIVKPETVIRWHQPSLLALLGATAWQVGKASSCTGHGSQGGVVQAADPR